MELTSYFTINLQCAPGRSDISGNCEVDEVVRTVTTLQLDSDKEGVYMYGLDYL